MDDVGQDNGGMPVWIPQHKPKDLVLLCLLCVFQGSLIPWVYILPRCLTVSSLWLAGLQWPGRTEKLGLDELKNFLSQVQNISTDVRGAEGVLCKCEGWEILPQSRGI